MCGKPELSRAIEFSRGVPALVTGVNVQEPPEKRPWTSSYVNPSSVCEYETCSLPEESTESDQEIRVVVKGRISSMSQELPPDGKVACLRLACKVWSLL